MKPVVTAEHHGEGIVEFHSALAGPIHSWRSALLLVLPASVGTFGVWSFDFATGWILLCIWIALFVVSLWKKMGQVQKESLLLIHDLGIQVKRSYVSGSVDRMFVERSRLRSVIINEGVGFSAVTYYLAFITSGDSELVLAFSALIPRIDHLVVIFHAARSIVFGEEVPDWHAATALMHHAATTQSNGSKPLASRQLFRAGDGGASAVDEAKKTQ